MTEYVPSPEDDELEAIIQRLVYRLDDAREGSAEHKMIMTRHHGKFVSYLRLYTTG
jgi:hypothetical protein